MLLAASGRHEPLFWTRDLRTRGSLDKSHSTLALVGASFSLRPIVRRTFLIGRRVSSTQERASVGCLTRTIDTKRTDLKHRINDLVCALGVAYSRRNLDLLRSQPFAGDQAGRIVASTVDSQTRAKPLQRLAQRELFCDRTRWASSELTLVLIRLIDPHPPLNRNV